MTRKYQTYFNGSLHYGGAVARQLIAGNNIPWLRVTWRKDYGERYRYSLECLLASAINAHLDPYADGWVIISRKDADWQSSRVYGDLSLQAVRAIFDAATTAGYIEMQIGYPARNDYATGRRTIYRITDKAIALLDAAVPGWQRLRQADARIGKSWVKDQATKKIINHCDPAAETALSTINTAAAAHTWEGLPTPAYYQVQIHDGYANVGGRIYTAAQNNEKIQRQDWRVDGEPMAEVDIVASHVNILYSICSLVAPGDPYAFAPRGARLFWKLLMLVTINASAPGAAVASILAQLNDPHGDTALRAAAEVARQDLMGNIAENFAGEDNNKGVHVVDGLSPSSCSSSLPTSGTPPPVPGPPPVRGINYKSFTKPFVEVALQQLRAAHQPISHYFGCGFGVRAMGIEGEIAMEVLLHCARAGIPCLNIHDGFVTAHKHLAAVQDILQQVLLRRGIQAPTKIKGLQIGPGSARSADAQGPAAAPAAPPPTDQPAPASTPSPQAPLEQPVAAPAASDAPTRGTPGNWAVIKLDEVYDDVAIYSLKPPPWTRWDVRCTKGRTYRVGWRQPQHWDVICLSGM